MTGSVMKLGVLDTMADALAPEGATIAWFEELGHEENHRWVDEDFSRRAFAAIAAAEGKTVSKTLVLTGRAIHTALFERGKPSPIAGAAFIKRYLFQYA